VNECDDKRDEMHCQIANWHRLLAICAILVFFSSLFVGYLRSELRGTVESAEEAIIIDDPSEQGIAIACSIFTLSI